MRLIFQDSIRRQESLRGDAFLDPGTRTVYGRMRDTFVSSQQRDGESR